MEGLSHRTRFLQSLERCSESRGFIPSFYERFLATSEEIREKFVDTDFERQDQMLLESLRLCAGATAGEPKTLRELSERARTHSRAELDIRPGLYDYWLEAIIETAREYDDFWDDDVEASWRSILGHVIQHMTRYY